MVSTVKMAGGGGTISPVAGTAQEVLDRSKTAWGAWGTAVKGGRSRDWSMTGLSCYKVSSTGLSIDQAETQFDAISGGTSNWPLPLSTSMVLTLNTGGPGARRRGRTYLGGFGTGAMGTTNAESGRFLTALCLAEAQYWAGLLNALDAANGPNTSALNPVVISNTSSPPAAFTITSVRAGNVPDVQRRRTADQVEAFQTVAVVPG
jgi:hypothetical protein